jgi:hypothetical protein
VIPEDQQMRDTRDSDYLARRTDHWHFEKRLSLDTLVAIAGVALLIGGPMLVWGRAMESRVQALEVVGQERSKQETALALDARDQRISILSRLDKMDEQITQLRVELGKTSTPKMMH